MLVYVLVKRSYDILDQPGNCYIIRWGAEGGFQRVQKSTGKRLKVDVQEGCCSGGRRCLECFRKVARCDSSGNGGTRYLPLADMAGGIGERTASYLGEEVDIKVGHVVT